MELTGDESEVDEEVWMGEGESPGGGNEPKDVTWAVG